MKSRFSIALAALLLAWLPATGKLVAAEETKEKKEVAKPVRNNVPVYTSSRVWIGILDKDAEVEVLLKAGQWCKVQYTKDGNRFVGWVSKDDLALPESPPPKAEEETQAKILSVKETSEQLRKLVRVGVDYKTSTGGGWDPKVTVGVSHPTQGNVEMKLRTDGQGKQAKLVVLARFRRDPVIELYVEQKIVELKQFWKVANPRFDRIIDSYVRALQAYNDNRIADFKRLTDSADRFWETIDSQAE